MVLLAWPEVQPQMEMTMNEPKMLKPDAEMVTCGLLAMATLLLGVLARRRPRGAR